MTPQAKFKNHKAYLGDLIGGSLMLRESQTIAELLLKSPTQDEWHDAIVNRNLLQKRSDASAKRNAATIKKRLAGLSDTYLEKLAFGGTELATQLMFAATLINSPMLADFMRNVVIDAKRVFREFIELKDWESFWEGSIRVYPELGSMSDTSTYKIAQVAFKLLADAGYIDSTRNKKLQNIFLLPEVRSLLAEMDCEDVIAAMEI
ncbi:hypothetical protein D210916BOD24_10920 [Alteromonas sp. D210916BOD_24]|uniref:DUF1819 family protein n=1 Tax=Alteromonas sp. D210916BOD_24 TaxID=3157618 RepID=UPI00399CC41D